MAVFREGEDIADCMTQDGYRPTFGTFPEKDAQSSPDGTNPIMVGIGKMIPRWDIRNIDAKPLVLRYYLDIESFDKDVWRVLTISTSLQGAADLWNDVNCGVRYESTADPAKAHFHVVYSKEYQSRSAASAFFPDDVSELEIYSKAFEDEKTKAQIGNSMTHELGHILGLRHEHAWDTSRGEPEAVLIGEWNDNSIMGYKRATRKLQQSDKDGLRKFYSLPVGTKIEGIPIVDFKPRLWKKK